MQPLSGNQRPDLLTALMNMSLVLHLPRKMHLCRPSSNVQRLPSFLEMPWKCYKTLTFCTLLTRCAIPCACHAKTTSERQLLRSDVVLLTFWLRNVLRATAACTFSTFATSKSGPEAAVFCTFWLRHVLRATTACTFWTSATSKSGPEHGVFCTFWLRFSSRHKGVHFFDISTSKSGPELVCWFVLDFDMCFAPQGRALFRHLNFQKWSGAWCVGLYILTWKCASRHNGVQFFISHLASWLRTRRFSEPTFRPSGASNHINHSGKTECFATFLPFRAPASSFFWLFLFSSIYLSTYLPTYLSISLSLYLFVCLSVYLSVYLQAWERSYSAKLPQFLKLTTSNM